MFPTPLSNNVSRVDHLVYATPSLIDGIKEIESLLGVRAIAGGQHLMWGTRNALVSLGDNVYLEIIGPDPEQTNFAGDRVFGIDHLDHSRLVTWAANGTNLNRLVERGRQQGQELGDVREGSRVGADGAMLSWRLTDPYSIGDDGLRPFFIDWGSTTHPAKSLSAACTLQYLRAEHPDPELVGIHLADLGLELKVSRAPRPALVATIDSPNGKVELR
jgi:hypothetical protein